MNDDELLKAYEPILCFAHSERFFPMDVKQYFRFCQVVNSNRSIDQKQSSIESVDSLGKIKDSHNYYLQFFKSDVWELIIGLIVLSIVFCAVGWFISKQSGVRVGLLISLGMALIVFIARSNSRLSIASSLIVFALYLYLFIWLPVGFFLSPPIPRWHLYYLIPLWLFLTLGGLIAMAVLIFEGIIPEAPGMVFELLSRATDTSAIGAFEQYKKILDAEPQPVYYGRVYSSSKDDKTLTLKEDNWKVLQYHFFYAFNDWRLAANGMNHHEGDWEMVAVYLKNDLPEMVIYSQHGAGGMRSWESAAKVYDEKATMPHSAHPIVYAALGSHANYGEPSINKSYELLEGHSERDQMIRKSVYSIDTRIRKTYKTLTKFLGDDSKNEVSLPVDIATGDGIRIGPATNDFKISHKESKSLLENRRASQLKSKMKKKPANQKKDEPEQWEYSREVKHPGCMDWKGIIISEETPWVQYKGSWGVKGLFGLLEGESGPPGPMWERSKNGGDPVSRDRWARPLKWMHDVKQLEEERAQRGGRSNK